MTDQPSFDALNDALCVSPDTLVSIGDYATRDELFFKNKAAARESLKEDAKIINELQDRLYAEKKQSLIVVFQGMDTSGKDGTTKAVFSKTSPLGINVAAFGKPSKRELAQDYLWRVHQVVPQKGQITVFNRSHYEDVLVVKVREFAPIDQIEARYEQINNFEKHLTENGTHILKCMLHISKETQKKRLEERLSIPTKRWKFNPADLDDRALWPEFQLAYQDVLNRCSTPYAPWFVIPSDSRIKRKAIIARLVRQKLEAMNPQIPDPGFRPEQFEITD